MAFISLFLSAILGIISIIGIILVIIGLTFLIIYKARRKAKKKKGFLIAAIVLLVIGTPTTFALYGFYTVANNLAINDYVSPKDYPVNNAVRKHDNEKLKKLLEKGADPNEIFNGLPAIFWACSNIDAGVNYRATKLLISYNADIYVKTSDQCSLMKDILIGDKRYDDQSDTYKIVKLLIEEGYNVNETDSNGVTMLMYAMVDSTIDKGYTLPFKLTELLIENGANINEVDNEGRTVLMWACGSIDDTTNKNETISKVPSISYKYQFSPFDYNIIKYLLENGIDVNVKDNQGFTALDYFNQTIENAKKWYQYDEISQTKDFINKCEEIETLLQGN